MYRTFRNCIYQLYVHMCRSILNIVSSFPLQVSGNTYCGLLDATDGIFRDCIRNATELAASYLENCRFDVCANMAIATSAKSAACGTLEAFSAQCSDLGYGQVDWRTAADCRKFTFYNFFAKLVFPQRPSKDTMYTVSVFETKQKPMKIFGRYI